MTASHMAALGGRTRTARRLLTAGALALLLAGCYRPYMAQDYPDDYRKRHPITVKEGERTVEVFVGRNRGGLTPTQRADVLAFATSWRREASSGIIVDVPQDAPTGRAAADSVREMHSIFAASGVPRRAVYVRRYSPAGGLTTIKISYSKLTAHAGPCGLWPRDLGPAFDRAYNENWNYWNLGCSHQRNLAAMVDNPADLLQPRGETPIYQARRADAINKYRKGENPSGTYSGAYDKGKISELGK